MNYFMYTSHHIELTCVNLKVLVSGPWLEE